jgi:hypothetical protein
MLRSAASMAIENRTPVDAEPILVGPTHTHVPTSGDMANGLPFFAAINKQSTLWRRIAVAAPSVTCASSAAC